ncbi:MAG: lipopolysaccharide biosynthesis protein [Solirubrobacteraceae bacterium]|nr:lipopolysaccharide biosynthesis protein [Solirubrobacteraceae bacterium]
MAELLKRLAASGLAYQSASLLAALLALFTLPLYTRNLTREDFGYAETLLTIVILTSILLRAGMGEAFVRHWFDDEHAERRRHLARATTSFVLVSTTVALVAGVLLAGPLSRLVLGTHDATLMAFGVLGVWTFTNLEVTYALLRVEERRRPYLIASAANVVLTVTLTVLLVVVFDTGARGYVVGNYAASGVVLLGLWLLAVREHIGPPARGAVALAPLLRFGAPTVPADAAIFLLNVIDRAYLLRVESPAAAGLYSVAVKLATAVIVVVRAFQLAWPPLAYSVTDDEQARRLYARVTSGYVVLAALAVAGFALLGRWVVRLLAAPAFFEAHTALPWLALGWALYGLHLVLVSIAGRMKLTVRTLPAALVGLVVNVVALVVLTGPLDIEGAAIALVAAYVASLAVLHLLLRRAFPVPFEWARVTRAVAVVGVLALAGELLLPAGGAAGFAARLALWLALAPTLVAAGVVTPAELRRLRGALGAGRRGSASAPAPGG